MKRAFYVIVWIVALSLTAAGCGKKQTAGSNLEQGVQREQTETILEELFMAAQESGEMPMIKEEFSEDTPYSELEEYLIDYYRIPEEEQTETRYYYNYTDLNEDGEDEIVAVVVGDYTEEPFGNPAVILSEVEDGGFTLLESFAGIHTPVLISIQMTNGWHDLVYQQFGGGLETGYCICHYQLDGGYQTDQNELVEENDMDGVQILSDNLIDDMDRGNYLTLKSATSTENN